MMPRTWVRIYRVGFASIGIGALSYQLIHLLNTRNNYRVLDFFSFFTVESNIFAALVLLAGAGYGARLQGSRRWALVRGAAFVYMATTGIVYGLLLAGYQEELQTTIPWVDTVVHRIMPLVMIVDWLVDRPSAPIEPRALIWWLAYPLVFVVYALIRGPLADWYPYPFLDPSSAGGYAAVGLYCLAIAGGIVLISWLTIILARVRPQ